MATGSLLALSVAVQLAAAWQALRLTRITGWRGPWLLLAGAIGLMAVRRSVTLGRLLSGAAEPGPDPVAEAIALAISLLMLGGLAGLAPLLRSLVESESARRRSEGRLRDVMDLVPHMIFAKDGRGRLLLANRAVAEAYGTHVEAVTGQAHEDLHGDAAELQQMLRDDREVMDSGRPKHIAEERFRDATGRLRVLETTKIPYRTEEGEPAVLGVAVDVTERKQVERALQERTRELERSNEELEQFAYAASHDLQTPLRSVVGFLQLLEEDCGQRLDEQGKEYLKLAVGGGRRMQALIQALLTYSQIGAGPAPRESVALNPLVDEIVHDFGPRIQELGARVTRSELPELVAVPEHLRRIFQNLIGNALTFHGADPPQVHVSARRDPDAWVFSVSDNGIGIDPAYQEQVFDLFRRLHAPGDYPGTGIGLAMVKKLVDRAGGWIRLESEPGKGTTFLFALPLQESPPTAPTQTSPAA